MINKTRNLNKAKFIVYIKMLLHCKRTNGSISQNFCEILYSLTRNVLDTNLIKQLIFWEKKIGVFLGVE